MPIGVAANDRISSQPMQDRMAALGLLFLLLLISAPLAAQVRLEINPPQREIEQNVLAYLGEVSPRNTREMRRFAHYARRQTQAALEALGYYQSEIFLSVEEGTPASLLIRIQPGEPVRFGQIDLQLLNATDTLITLPQPEQLRTGQRLSHQAYEAAKRSLRNQALELGYFSYRFTRHEMLIDPEQGIADVHLHFDPGPRYQLGEVVFLHEGELSDDFLQRFVRFAPGTPYHIQWLADLNRDLRASGYFQEVLLETQEDESTPHQLRVEAQLRMRAPRTLNLGLGYSTDIGPRVTAQWTQHWMNAQGFSRGFETEVSEPRQGLELWWQKPLGRPATDRLRLTSSITQESFDEQESLRYGAGLAWHHRQANQWDRVISLRGEREDFRVGETEDATWLTLPGLSYARVQRDRPLDPQRGYRLQMDLLGSRETLLSDVDLLQLQLAAKALTTWRLQHRFLARLQLGGLATNNFDRIPASLRFYAGGDQSVRGYAYQDLAPRNSRDELVGGRYLISSTLEYQYQFSDRWRWAGYVDAGQATRTPNELLEPKVGIGTGLRWISLVGPIKLDVAYGLDDEQGGWRIHFSMGPDL